MGKKPNRGNTPEQPPPIDDDAHWMRLLDAVMLLFEQTHEMDLVELDIDQALAVGKLSSMRRNLTTGTRLKDVLRVVCPNGVPTGTKDKDVLTLVKSKYKDEGWELPKRDVIARALGRRK